MYFLVLQLEHLQYSYMRADGRGQQFGRGARERKEMHVGVPGGEGVQGEVCGGAGRGGSAR